MKDIFEHDGGHWVSIKGENCNVQLFIILVKRMVLTVNQGHR
jgi:hypothetical protein